MSRSGSPACYEIRVEGVLDSRWAAWFEGMRVESEGGQTVIRGLVIDPYNEIEHRRPPNMTETEYVSQLLGKVKRFAQNHGVHVWIVAHPAKIRREGNSLPVPTLYDISGSANWANKADLGIVVHRDPETGPTRTDIYIRKVRFKSVGKIGAASLRWDRATGRYAEIAPAAYGAARAYRDD